MGFFNKSDKQTNNTTNTTVISAGTTVTGLIDTTCALHIDGKHDGEIKSNNRVSIGSQGNVGGEITAKNLAITGTFVGTADCDQVDVLEGGQMQGKIIADQLTIDQNCNFEGESVKRSAAKIAAPAPVASLAKKKS